MEVDRAGDYAAIVEDCKMGADVWTRLGVGRRGKDWRRRGRVGVFFMRRGSVEASTAALLGCDSHLCGYAQHGLRRRVSLWLDTSLCLS